MKRSQLSNGLNSDSFCQTECDLSERDSNWTYWEMIRRLRIVNRRHDDSPKGIPILGRALVLNTPAELDPTPLVLATVISTGNLAARYLSLLLSSYTADLIGSGISRTTYAGKCVFMFS